MDRETALESYQEVIRALNRDGGISRPGIEKIVEVERSLGNVTKQVSFEELIDFTIGEEVVH